VPVEPLAGKVVIDTNNYYPKIAGRIAELDDESTTTSELLQAHLPDSQVVKAFNNIWYVALEQLARASGAPDRSALVIAGDDASAKATVTDFLDRLRGIDGAVHGLEQAKQGAELADIGFDGAGHVGILQLARQRLTIVTPSAMHLAERGGGGRFMLEAREAFFPLGTKLGAHAPLHERPAHRRRMRLQFAEFFCVRLRQQVRNGGEQLRHLH